MLDPGHERTIKKPAAKQLQAVNNVPTARSERPQSYIPSIEKNDILQAFRSLHNDYLMSVKSNIRSAEAQHELLHLEAMFRKALQKDQPFYKLKAIKTRIRILKTGVVSPSASAT